MPPLPSVQVEFENLSYSVQVKQSDDSVQTVGRAMTSLRKPPTKTLTILNNLTGIIPPGTMTLVMAPPGHGVSSFMKALAGRLDKKNLSGQVWYAGTPIEEVNPYRIAAYVDQLDNHLPQLTVEETFDFARQCLGTPGLLSKTARDAFSKKSSNVIDLFGLANAKDTIVGNDLIRGVSGGERKRVTVGEMLMGNQRVWFNGECFVSWCVSFCWCAFTVLSPRVAFCCMFVPLIHLISPNRLYRTLRA